MTVPGLRTVLLAAAALGIAAVLGAGAVRLAVDAGDVRAAVADAIGRDGARDLTIGAIDIDIWPRPRAVMTDVAIGGERSVSLTAARIEATLRLVPLLFGHVELATVTIDGGTVAVQADRVLASRSAAAGIGSHPDLRVNGVTVALAWSDGRSVRLDDITGQASWSGHGLALDGRARLRGEAFETAISVADAAALARGARSAVRIRASGPLMRVAFDGHGLIDPRFQLEGALSADGSSARAVLAWLGVDAPARGGVARFALKGQGQASSSQIALTQAVVELDGNRAEGGLAVRFDDDRAIIQGTLATESLVLTPYLPVDRMRLGSGRTDRFDLSPLAAVDADVRLSVGRIVVGQTTFGRAAGALLIRSGRLSATIGEAQVFAGTVRGAVALAPSASGVELKIEASARDLDLDRATTDLFGARRMEGKATLTLNLEGEGATWAELLRSAAGTFRVSAASGAVTGINVEQILRRVERRPLSGIGDPRGGRTAFDRLAVQVRIVQGTATCDEARLESAAVRVGLAGTASLPERGVDLRGTAALVRTSGGGFELPFVVRGPWSDPAVVPDTDSLIRRSGAAAPLLEAIRQREVRPTAPSDAAPAPAPPTGAAERP